MKIKLWRKVQVKCLLPMMKNKKYTEISMKNGGMWPEEVIFAVCYMTIVTLFQLPFEEIDGKRVPKLFLNMGQLSIYKAFIISLMLAFSVAVSAMSNRDDNPKIARFCRRLAIVSLSVSAAILIWVVALVGFWWVLNFAE